MFEPVCNELAAGVGHGTIADIAQDVTPWKPASRDPKQSWWQWLCCCFVIYGTSFLYGLDFTITACMQDSIVATFGNGADLTWIGMGFPLGSLILILPVGYIFGLFENRMIYVSSIIVFLVGSVVCGAAPDNAAIIAGRIIAGAGGGGMYLGALNAIGSLTKRKERTVYAAFTGFFYGIGVIVGPIIGGALANSSATWRWGFYMIAIVSGVLAVSTITLPAMHPRPGVSAVNTLRRMDWLGTVLFAAIAVSWSVMLSGGGADWSWLNARTWVLLAILVIAIPIFVVQQHYNVLTTETWKIFPTEFLRSRALVALFIATAASASALYVTTYYTPLIFQLARGESPVDASIRIIPLMALFIAAVVVQGVFMPRLGAYMPWYAIGGIFILVGGALLCTVDTSTSAAAIQGYTVLVGLGGGLCLQAAYAITTAKVKGEKLASAISFINVAQIGAGVMSLTIAGAIYQNIGSQRLASLGASLGSLSAGSDAVNAADQAQVADVITDTIRRVFILVAVAGAIVLISALAMPMERLFYTKKGRKGRRTTAVAISEEGSEKSRSKESV